MSERYALLWVDATISRREVAITEPFERAFEIHHYAYTGSLESEIEKVNPSVICLDFDFPTKAGLKLLQRTKLEHSRIPLLMLTVQHSESLAVWAFRSRVWDYLVKPIAKLELERSIVGLREMLELQLLQKIPRTPAIVKALMPEENRSGARGNSSLQLAPAVEYVEKNFREKVSSGEVAALCGQTSFQFSRTFKETYGLTFQDYLLRYRIREACRLLKNPAAEITEVACLSGFNEPSYFGKVFRRYMSCSASEYRTANHTAIDPNLLDDILKHPAHSNL